MNRCQGCTDLERRLAAAEAERDEWMATAKRLSMKLGGVKDA